MQQGPAGTPIIHPALSISGLIVLVMLITMAGVWLAALVVFGFMLTIVAHEFGHAWRGRRRGLLLEQFMIGFGPRLFSWRSKRSDTEYGLRLYPLGAFVKFWHDEDAQLGGWAKQDMLIAGPAANILIALILMFGIQIGQGVAPMDAARNTGSATVQMTGSIATTVVKLPVIAVGMAKGAITNDPPPPDARTISPVAIGSLANDASHAPNPLWTSLALIAVLSFSVGLANLLPIPPLDGGVMFFSAIEDLSHRVVPKLVVNTVMYGFFGVMVLSLLAATVLDYTHPLGNPFVP